jgi:hypothetical protein
MLLAVRKAMTLLAISLSMTSLSMTTWKEWT